MRLCPHGSDLQRTHGVPHRLRLVGRVQGYMLWDDALAYHGCKEEGDGVLVHAAPYRLIDDDASLYRQNGVISVVVVTVSD